ncbi:hypothetical protein [Streptomyces roseochromogenus]|uniref:Uncharacterized protein n=1 Tax=Streptomyces roseochromogenus subsp. oscitans DS 12.976 TaxID=1352936 RepID=V6KT17_STRRC|nr:hypothetical protein [Streptomyces roseochromogenus]EST35267.1 hypothetical protein M878_06625 [Streptomyces roseochromogenus subsp. oscitans DS 12.976]
MPTTPVITWDVSESRGYETAWAEPGDGTLTAHDRAVGTLPEPYRITYELGRRTGM